jgi:hypothetical protein
MPLNFFYAFLLSSRSSLIMYPFICGIALHLYNQTIYKSWIAGFGDVNPNPFKFMLLDSFHGLNVSRG